MADPDDHASAVQFESTYDVMFYVGNPSNEIKTSDSSTTMESNNVMTHEKSHRESRTTTRKEIRHTSSKSKINEIRQSSSTSKMCDTMSVETKEVKMQSNKEKVSETVTYSNGPNTDNGRASEDRNTSPPASMSNRSSRSPRSPASPTALSPQSPTHWSISARTSPSVSTG